MKLIVKICSYIMTISLIILTITYLLMNIISSTILNKNYVLSKIDESNYYEKIYEEVNSNFENYIYQSGLNETVIKDLVTKEKIKKDVKILIDNVYEGKSEEIPTLEIEENLRKNIEETIENKKILITQKEQIDKFVKQITSEYKATMLSYNFESKINNVYVKITKAIEIIKTPLLIGIILICLAILLINIKTIYRGISYLGINLISSGVFLIVLKIYIAIKIKVGSILLFNESFSVVLRKILGELLGKVLEFGILFLAIGVALTILSNLLDNKKEEKEEELKKTRKK